MRQYELVKKQKIALEERKVQIRNKAIKFHKVFDTRDGKEVLGFIKSEFHESELTNNKDTNAIIVKAAQRDVIDYIERMCRQGESHGSNSES